MTSFLKTFGEGFLYFIGLPFILVGLVIYGLYLLIVFIVMSIKGIVLFFKGKKYSLMLPEDKLAEEILNQQMQPQTAIGPQQLQPQQNVTYHNTFNQINLPNSQNPNQQAMTSAKFFDGSNQPNHGIDNQNPQYIENNEVPTIGEPNDQNTNEGGNE
ncbi:MAG: hypothetical protein H6689_02740 [Erysipelotrichaceae bacterium]|nr:hypothetical protein [Erysipelotrichaceae bacterium]MCB9500145.1 hypothetical protein [Erysipelotrichaceae bacterium]